MPRSSIAHEGPAEAEANGLTFVWDAFGDRSNTPLVLVAGLGSQMISWDEPFCEALAGRGLWVVRFDNRDAGLSTHRDHLGIPDLAGLYSSYLQGEPIDAPYSLLDMAEDTAALLHAIEIASAHVMGVSLGAMIAQELAIHHPDRIRSLTCLMSTTGRPDLLLPEAEVLQAMLRPPPRVREAYVEHILQWRGLIQGPAYEDDEGRVRERAGRIFDRGLYPDGSARQMAAVLASGDREPALKELDCPTLVIHGDADPVMRVEGGLRIAELVPGADLLILPGLGHTLPPAVWPQVEDALVEFIRSAERKWGG